MKTTLAKADNITKKWYVIDATNLVLGRTAVSIATVLMGKHRPIYTPHVDTGEYIVVINAEKIRLSGNKINTKIYRHHTIWPGGLKEVHVQKKLEHHPEDVLMLAVRRMLPKTLLGKQMIDKLKIYRGPEHPHSAQKPESFPYPLKKYVE